MLGLNNFYHCTFLWGQKKGQWYNCVPRKHTEIGAICFCRNTQRKGAMPGERSRFHEGQWHYLFGIKNSALARAQTLSFWALLTPVPIVELRFCVNKITASWMPAAGRTEKNLVNKLLCCPTQEFHFHSTTPGVEKNPTGPGQLLQTLQGQPVMASKPSCKSFINYLSAVAIN